MASIYLRLSQHKFMAFLFTLWFIFVLGSVYVTAVLMAYLRAVVSKNLRYEFQLGGRFLALWIRRLCRFQIQVSGTENIPMDKTVIFVGNHQSNMDILFLIGAIPRNAVFIAKRELYKVPVLAYTMRISGQMIVDRQRGREAVRNMKAVIERINQGQSVIIFPEGTRSIDGKMRPFKKGLELLLKHTEAVVVPVVISGSVLVNPKGSLFLYQRPVSITFLQQLTPEEKASTQVTSLLYDIIQRHLP